MASKHARAEDARSPRLAERLAAPIRRFLAVEAASTILLVIATALALGFANSGWHEAYEHLWHTSAGVRIGDWSFELSLAHWVNDGLMVLFFFVVGMEIKHELVHGELSSRRRAMLPIFGALGGMLAPAAIYLLLHAGGPAASGWGVPMATDIAFAVAALTVLGARVPPGLKIFLLALAIVDDLGAVTVIAVFYTHGVSFVALGAVAAGLALVYGMNRAGVRAHAAYWLVGIGIWAATLASGIHATVAGVLLGFLTPAETLDPRNTVLARAQRQVSELLGALEQEGDEHARTRALREIEGLPREALSPLAYLTATLHPLVAFVIMPIFALANAGVRLEARTLSDPTALHVFLAVALGLLAGKPLGITLLAWIAVRLRVAELPQGVSWGAIAGAGLLAGIGFTMALFITVLAFEAPALVAASKLGVLAASVIATALGMAALVRVLPRETPPGGPPG